jgi:hypothetical protein
MSAIKNSENTKVLLLINTMTYFTCLVEIARLLERKSALEPLFCFPQYYPNIERDISIVISENMNYIIGFKERSKKEITIASPNVTGANYIISLLKDIMRYLHVRTLYYLAVELLKYHKEFKKARRLMRKEKPGLLVLAGDNLGYNTSIFVKVCHENNIPSVIIPSWMAGPKEAAEAHYCNPEHDCREISNYIASVILPNYAYEYRGKKILRWPAYKIFAMKLFGVSPPLPWVLNSGEADAILVESKAMLEYMLQEGLPAEQVKLVGSLANDVIYNNQDDLINKKNRLYKQLNMPADRPLILSALPPDQLYGYGRPECEFKTYREIVEMWIKSLAAGKKYNIIISLHPSVKYEELKYIEEWGVRIFQDNIKRVIPLCDIFVASISSTIQWAIVCGKPTINYDVYKYKYTDYENVDSVIYADNINDFMDILNKLCNDKEYYASILKAASDNKKAWGEMDGKCGERILSCFEELMRGISPGA